MTSKLILYLILISLQGCCTTVPKPLGDLDTAIHQVIIVSPVKNGSCRASLSTWQRQGSSWRRELLASAMIGKNGLAAANAKREGDGKTPSGIYPLETAFGYAPSIDTGLSYRQASTDDFWVDDVTSVQYNEWVKGPLPAGSFERMKRFDNLYQYGIVIGYNRHPVVRGAGSAIFIHVWRRYDSPTSGCVALNQRNIRRLLHWLKQQYQPVIILE